MISYLRSLQLTFLEKRYHEVNEMYHLRILFNNYLETLPCFRFASGIRLLFLASLCNVTYSNSVQHFCNADELCLY